MMTDFVTVANMQEIPPGTGRTVEVDGIWIAVFNVEGAFYAIDNTCPHAGGPLGEGHLMAAGGMPVARMAIQRHSGERVGNPNFTVACCAVRIQGNEVQIAIPPDETSVPGVSRMTFYCDNECRSCCSRR